MTTAVANTTPDMALGNLPKWDLSDLYPAPDSAELKADLEEAARKSRIFSDRYKGKLAGLSGGALGAAISEYEVIDEIMGRIMSYAQLVYAEDVSDPEAGQFYQSMQERVNDISADVLFFSLELNEIEDHILLKQMKAASVLKYKPWLDSIRS